MLPLVRAESVSSVLVGHSVSGPVRNEDILASKERQGNHSSDTRLLAFDNAQELIDSVPEDSCNDSRKTNPKSRISNIQLNTQF